MKNFICPYCYGLHTLKDVKMKCAFNIAGQSKSCIDDSVTKDAGGWISDKDKARCFKCRETKQSYFCPLAQKEIPQDFLHDSGGFSVAMIGAKASGKSNYIGVLVQEIRNKMVAPFDCYLSLDASEETKTTYHTNYYVPLYQGKRPVDATRKVEIPPMIFPLQFWKNHKKAVLTFYDTAGENFDSAKDILQNNKYLTNANGIILLLDPLQVPSIRASLQGKMQLPAQNTDVKEILSRVVQNIRDVKKIKGKIKTPVALVFTKIDALEEHDLLIEDSALKEESAHLKRGVFVDTDLQSVHSEIDDLLISCLGEEVQQILKNFESYRFFGLSALGSSSTSNLEIHPRRVLDPLLWLLAENKYIPRVKK